MVLLNRRTQGSSATNSALKKLPLLIKSFPTLANGNNDKAEWRLMIPPLARMAVVAYCNLKPDPRLQHYITVIIMFILKGV